MSGKRFKKLRYEARHRRVNKMIKWLEEEPPMIFIFSWYKWKKNRPCL